MLLSALAREESMCIYTLRRYVAFLDVYTAGHISLFPPPPSLTHLSSPLSLPPSRQRVSYIVRKNKFFSESVFVKVGLVTAGKNTEHFGIVLLRYSAIMTHGLLTISTRGLLFLVTRA